MNIKAAKNLVALYKSLTLKELSDTFEKMQLTFKCKIQGGDVLEELTGFGSTGSCMLCKETKELCHGNEDAHCLYCIYSLNAHPGHNMFCLDSTYDAIADAENAKDLYDAIQTRIKHLEETIGLYENTMVFTLQ